jgi:hypothetical protein
MKAHPGAMEAHPGATEAHTGAMDIHPGAMEAHSEATEAHLGALEAYPRGIVANCEIVDIKLTSVNLSLIDFGVVPLFIRNSVQIFSEFRGIPRNFAYRITWNSSEVKSNSEKIPTSAKLQKSTVVDTLLPNQLFILLFFVVTLLRLSTSQTEPKILY